MWAECIWRLLVVGNWMCARYSPNWTRCWFFQNAIWFVSVVQKYLKPSFFESTLWFCPALWRDMNKRWNFRCVVVISTSLAGSHRRSGYTLNCYVNINPYVCRNEEIDPEGNNSNFLSGFTIGQVTGCPDFFPFSSGLRECLGTNLEITRDCPSSAHLLSSSLHVKHPMIQRCVTTNAALVS
jgi:hypothetical protein